MSFAFIELMSKTRSSVLLIVKLVLNVYSLMSLMGFNPCTTKVIALWSLFPMWFFISKPSWHKLKAIKKSMYYLLHSVLNLCNLVYAYWSKFAIMLCGLTAFINLRFYSFLMSRLKSPFIRIGGFSYRSWRFSISSESFASVLFLAL